LSSSSVIVMSPFSKGPQRWVRIVYAICRTTSSSVILAPGLFS